MQKHVHYNLSKILFNYRRVTIWNRLPDYVFSANSVGVYEKRLDYFWRDQARVLALLESQYNWNW